ncbi:MAG: cysteine desulfurase family protein [Ndongobacter sp.]|nr:cysteine desulfurase family protein [Ndongobacter sp.]
MIYFDNAATTAPRAEVRAVVDEVLREDWGNPSSLHRKGLAAERRLEDARARIAARYGVKPKTLIFTSCATESNNTVIRGMLRGRKRPNIVVSPIEHSSIFELAKVLEQESVEVRWLPVDGAGRVAPSDVAARVDRDTALVCVMHVNNELGTVQPIREIGQILRQNQQRARFLVDGVQGFGKLPLRLDQEPIDFYTASGHKIHAPKGIGLLYVREGVSLPPLLVGGGQERGLRPGTENVAFACGMAKALELMLDEKNEVAQLCDFMRGKLAEREGVRINSPSEACSPYILNIGVREIKAEILLHYLEQENIYVSTGSACTGGAPSHVLQAVSIPKEFRDGCIRLSFHTDTTREEMVRFLDAFDRSVARIRSIIGKGVR